MFFPAILALALTLPRILFILSNPSFTGDSGFRLMNASKLIFCLGNRYWLPFLQLHIWIFYNLKLPYYAFKFIPCFYFFIALLFLAKLTYKIIGRNSPVFLFSALLMLGFSCQGLIMFLSVNLYQEMLEVAFLYILLYSGALDLKKSKSLFVAAAVALLIRDTFWVYLFVLTLLNYKKIISDKTYFYSFVFFWLIPISWLGMVPFRYSLKFSRLPQSLLEWPLMINKSSPAISNLFVSIESLCVALSASKAIFLAASLVVVWVFKVLYFKKNRKPETKDRDFGAKFKVFSLASLVIIYFLFLLFNPWESTFGNMRMAAPLLAHAFIWVALFYKESFVYPAHLRLLVNIILIFGIFLTTSFYPDNRLFGDNSYRIKAYSRIEQLNDRYGKKAKVCIVENDYWLAVENFAVPTLYMERRFLKKKENDKIHACDIVIASSDFKLDDKRFSRHSELRVKNKYYTVYIADTKSRDFK